LLVGATDQQRGELGPLLEGAGASNVSISVRLPPGEIPALLAAADVLIAPETDDHRRGRHASPLKIFEYMAAGKPIVAGDTPAVREVLVNGLTARLVPPSDPSALASAIRALLDEPGSRAELAKNARRAVEPYSWKQRAREVLAAFECRGSGSRPT
jgi:glycosyltransferase involved in cell wall biosynthesis